MKPSTLGEVTMVQALPVARIAVHVIASLGVSKVVGDVIKNNTTVVTTADAVKVYAGGLVLGSIIVDAASEHVTDRMNSISEWYASRKSPETVTE